MAEEVKNHCSGDCKQCHPVQRMYCSSQIAYNNMLMLADMQEEIASLKKEIRTLRTTDVELINPTTQEGEAV